MNKAFFFFAHIVLLLLAGCQASTEIIYLPGPSDPRPYGGFEQGELWAPAKGDKVDRMKLVGEIDPDPWSFPNRRTIYRTTWKTNYFAFDNEIEELLVVIQTPEGALGAFTQWQVFVYGQDLKMIDYGHVVFSEMNPLGIVEVNVENPKLPDDHNNTWKLAVISSRSNSAQASGQGLPLWEFPADPYFDIELVHWNNAFIEELPYGYGNIQPDDLKRIEYRQAEPKLVVTPENILQFKD